MSVDLSRQFIRKLRSVIVLNGCNGLDTFRPLFDLVENIEVALISAVVKESARCIFAVRRVSVIDGASLTPSGKAFMDITMALMFPADIHIGCSSAGSTRVPMDSRLVGLSILQ